MIVHSDSAPATALTGTARHPGAYSSSLLQTDCVIAWVNGKPDAPSESSEQSAATILVRVQNRKL